MNHYDLQSWCESLFQALHEWFDSDNTASYQRTTACLTCWVEHKQPLHDAAITTSRCNVDWRFSDDWVVTFLLLKQRGLDIRTARPHPTLRARLLTCNFDRGWTHMQLHAVQAQFTIDLHPSRLNDVVEGVREHLSSLLLR